MATPTMAPSRSTRLRVIALLVVTIIAALLTSIPSVHGQTCATGYSSDGNVLTSVLPNRFPYIPSTTLQMDLSYKSFTISMWIRLSKINLLQCALGHRKNDTDNCMMYACFQTNNKMVWAWNNYQTYSQLSTSAAYTTDIGVWHQWTFMYSATLLERRIYRDGVAVGLTYPYGSYLAQGNYNLIFASSERSTNTLNGQIDEIRVWYRTLDATTELPKLAQGIVWNTASMVAYIAFARQTSTTEPDQSYTGNTMSFSGTPQWTLTNPLCLPAGRKIWIISPSSLTTSVGGTFTITLLAVDSNNVVVPNYNSSVTVVLTGSATGGGSKTITNGIATATITDTVAETITVSLTDSASGGLAMTNTTALTFVAVVPTKFVILPPAGAATGSTASITIQLTDAYNNPVKQAKSVKLITTYTSGTGTGGNTVYTTSASTGQVVASVTSGTGGQGVTLSFLDTSSTGYDVSNTTIVYFTGTATKIVVLTPLVGNVDAPISVTIQVQDAASLPVQRYATTTMQITASGAAVTGAGAITLVRGQAVILLYSQSNATSTLTLTDTASTGLTLVSNSVTFNPGKPRKFVFVNALPAQVTNGTWVTLYIQLQDQFGNVARNNTRVQVATTSLFVTFTPTSGIVGPGSLFLDQGQGIKRVNSSTPGIITFTLRDIGSTGMTVTSTLIYEFFPYLCPTGQATDGQLDMFNGNQFVSYPNLAFPVDFAAASFSIMMWVRRATTGTQWLFVSGNVASATVPIYNGQLSFGFQYDKFRLDFGLNYLETTQSYAADRNVWVHWCVTFDYVNSVRAIYRNGALIATGSSVPLLESVHNQIDIGRRVSPTSYFIGSIDEVRIFERLLTTTEIAAGYANTLTSPSASVTWLHFSEGTGTIAYDSSPALYNYTLTSGGSLPQWSIWAPLCLSNAPNAKSFYIVPPTTAGATTSATITVQALDVSSNIVTGYAGTVTLVVTGSAVAASGSSLTIALTAGQGTMSLTDATPETVTLSLNDTAGSGLTATSTSTIAFILGPLYAFRIVKPIDQIAGGSATVTIRSEDVYGNVVANTATSKTVTLKTTGAATPASTAIVFAVGQSVKTQAITDATRQAVTLSLADTSSSGLDVSSTRVLTFTGPASTYAFITPVSGTVDAAIPVTIQVKDAFGTVASWYSGSVKLVASPAVNSGAGIVTFSSGVVVVSLVCTTAQTVTLSLSDTSSTGLTATATTSVTFAIGAASQFVILGPSGSLLINTPYRVTVQVTDSYGNVVPTITTRVTLYSSSVNTTGQGIVNITNGVYIGNFSDAAGEGVQLALGDTSNTGYAVTSTDTLVFFAAACPAATTSDGHFVGFGNNEVYNLNKAGALDLSGTSFTVMFWIRRKATGAAYVLALGTPGATDGYLQIGFDSGNHAFIDVGNDGGNSLYSGLTYTVLNGWQFWAFTYDRETTTYHNIYRGRDVPIGGWCYTPMTSSVVAALDGIGASRGANGLIGYLDELRVYKRVFSQTEIYQAYMNVFTPSQASYLTLYYPFSDQYGGTVTDYSVKGLTGQATNQGQWGTVDRLCLSTASMFVLSVSSASAAAGASVTATVTVTDPDGVLAAFWRGWVTLQVNGSATIDQPLVRVINGVGTATISNTVAQSVRVTLNDTNSHGLTATSYKPITFTVGTLPVKFAIIAPLGGRIGVAQSVTIQTQDINGNRVNGVSVTVTLTCSGSATGCGSLTFTGQGIYTVSDSVAELVTLTLAETSASGYTAATSTSTYFTGAPAAFTLITPSSSISIERTAMVTIRLVDSGNRPIYWNPSGSYQVTLVATGTGTITGATAYTLSFGSAVAPITNTEVETVALSLVDTSSIGLGVSATGSVTFVAGFASQIVILPPLNSYLTVATPVTLQALDSQGNLDVTYSAYIVLVSTNVPNLQIVQLTNGVGISSVVSATTITLTLSLSDDYATFLDVVSTQTVSFSAVATKFVFITPSNAYITDHAPVTIQAQTAASAVATGFYGTVTLVTSSNSGFSTVTTSGSLSGVVQVVGGYAYGYVDDVAPESVTLSLQDSSSTGYTVSSTTSLTFIGTTPVIWRYYPVNLPTAGGQSFTLVGAGFLPAGVCASGEPTITFTFPSGIQKNCPITFHNSTYLVCTVPVGSGWPQVTLSVCGIQHLDLPRWKYDDYFWVWNGAAATDYCVTTHNPDDVGSHTWGDNNWCSKGTRARVDWRWVYRGQTPPTDTHRCTNIMEPKEYAAWTNVFFCVPKESPFMLEWSYQGENYYPDALCMAIREGSDPNWSDGSHYLCDTSNVLLGDEFLLYHYANPTILNVIPNHGPTVGNITITLIGTSFGQNGSEYLGAGITIGGKTCTPNYQTWNHTYVECNLPAGEGLFNDVIITVAALVSVAFSPQFAYDPPLIANVLPILAMTSGGTTLTLTGINFGSSGTVTLGGTTCTVLTYADQLITCTLAVGEGINLEVTVTTSNQLNKVKYYYSYAPPIVTSVVPFTGLTAGAGLTITINGTSFGRNLAGTKVTIGGSLCQLATWTHTQIQCQLPPGEGVNQEVKVYSVGQASLWPYSGNFNYTAPTISSISPTGGKSGQGLYLRLNGASFGQDATVTVNGAQCNFLASAASREDAAAGSILVCGLPDGSGANVPVQITVAGQVSNIALFSYAPVITNWYMTAPTIASTAGGNTVTVTGTGFSSAAVATINVSIGGFACPVTLQNETILTCTLPVGQGSNLPLIVTVGSQSSDSYPFSYNSPVVGSIIPANSPTLGGNTIVLTGDSFGNGTMTSVTVGGKACTPILAANHTTIICVAPAGSGKNKPVIVTTASLTSNTILFSYDPPSLTTLSPVNGDTIGLYNLTIFGADFSTTTAALVTVAGQQRTPLSQTDTQIVITMPAKRDQDSGSVDVNVIVDSQTSNTLSFRFNAPNITVASPLNGPSQGGTIITLQGTSFGVSGVVKIGGKLCTSPTYAQTLIYCTVPANQGLSQSIVITATGGLASANSWVFNYDAPNVTYIAPTHAATQTTSGQIITIHGSSMGTYGTIMIGGSACDPAAGASTSWDDFTIKCQLADGQGTSLPVVVTASTQFNSYQPLFNYDPPTITNILPFVGSTSGADWTTGDQVLLTIYGTNFGTLAIVTVGGKLCAAGIGQSHTQIQCKLPPGEGLAQQVKVNVSGQVTTSTFDYDVPTVGKVFPLNGPTQGGTQITVRGTNFGLGGSYAITFAGVAIPTSDITFVNGSMMTFTLPRGSGLSKTLSVTISGQSVTYAGTRFGYQAPSLTSITGCPSDSAPKAIDCPLTGNYNITINGANFGDDASLNNVTIGGLPCRPVYILTSDSQMICNLSSNPYGGFNILVAVGVNGQLTSQSWLSYSGPSFTANTIVYNQGDTSTGHLDLTTSNLGLSSMSSSNPTGFHLSSSGTVDTIYLSGKFWGTIESAITITYGVAGSTKIFTCTVVAGTLVTTSNGVTSTIGCQVSQGGVGSNLVFVIQVGLLTSAESTDSISYPTPYIAPATIRGPIDGTPQVAYFGLYSEGDIIHFNVSSVGNDASLITVRYGLPDQVKNQICLNPVLTTYMGYLTLGCTTSPGYGGGYIFQLQALNSLSNNGTDTYDYITPPEVYGVFGCQNQTGNFTYGCPTVGGTLLTILGNKFNEDGISVRIGENGCTNVQVKSPTLLYCTLPAGAGTEVAITVIVESSFSLPVQLLSYTSATIATVVSDGTCTNTAGGISVTSCPRVGSSVITITGTNFGLPTAIVLVGGVECTNVIHDATTPHNKLTCQLPSGTKTDRAVMLIQSGGSLTTGTQTVSYLQCAAGTYSIGDTIACSPCASGSYTSTLGAQSCKACDAGYYSSAGVTECTACDPGTYSVQTSGGAGAPNCTSCAIGRYSASSGVTACGACDSGSYANVTGVSLCTSCTPGTFNPTQGLTVCQACTSGLYTSFSGGITCDPCPVGTRAELQLGASTCIDCVAGQFTGTTGKTVCSSCTAGYYGPVARLGTCLACDPGSYSNTTELTTCFKCPVGRYSVKNLLQGATTCTDCDLGYFVGATGQATCLRCNKGEYGNTKGLSVCNQCLWGTYGDDIGLQSCTPCTKGGYAAVNGSVECLTCGVGTFSADRATTCTACGAGTHQSSTGGTTCDPCDAGSSLPSTGQASCLICDGGYYTNGTQYSTCSICPAGSVSTKGSTGATICSACVLGKFASVAGQDTCQDCPIGYYGATIGLTVCSQCTAGTITGSPGLTACTNCSLGSISTVDGAFACTQCTSGTYSTGPGLSFCTDCSKGFAQATPGQSSCLPCAGGSFTASDGQATCTNCAAGYVSTYSVTGTTVCTACSIGSAQSVAGSSSCTPCSAGSAQGAPGQVSCIQCGAGYRAPNGSMTACVQCSAGTVSSPTTASFPYDCTACPMGKYAGYDGMAACVDCPAGSYSDDQGFSVCTLCDYGQYRQSGGTTSCQDCAKGYSANSLGSLGCADCTPGKFSSVNGSSECSSCPVGYWQNVADATFCNGCIAGTYTDVSGQVGCTNCTIGSHASAPYSTICDACIAGTYAPTVGLAECLPCDMGWYNADTSLTLCTQCAAGSFGNDTGLTECYTCGSGVYSSLAGSTECTSCEPGRYNEQEGQSTCITCFEGTASNDTGRVIACDSCVPGYFQGTAGMTSCDQCRIGEASTATGAAACIQCRAGHYGNATGLLNCYECPIGTQQSSTGQSNCTACEIGKATSVTATESCSDCAAGSFTNVTGTVTCRQCLAGTVQPFTGRTICNDCIAGTRINSPGQTECVSCETGSFTDVNATQICTKCLAGSWQGQPGHTYCDRCQLGRFSITTGETICTQCQPGSFGNTTGLQECYSCQPGSYQDQPEASSCKQCQIGRANSAPDRGTCGVCAPGYFANDTGMLECLKCPRGTYGTEQEATTCLSCRLGSYQDGEGQTACIDCAAGHTTAVNGSLKCDECAIGYFQALPGGTSCDPCITGTYQDTTGQSTCPSCDTGTFTNVTGLTECYQCGPGREQPYQRQSTCSQCLTGTYKGQTGREACDICDAGSYTALNGSLSCSSCIAGKAQGSNHGSTCDVCTPGKTAASPSATICADCAAGSFSNTSMALGCYSCPAGKFQSLPGYSYCSFCYTGKFSTAIGASDCTRCPAGTYTDVNGTQVCSDCPSGTYMDDLGASVCTSCALGSANSGTRRTSPCGLCAAGSFGNATKLLTCLTCAIGRAQPQNGLSYCSDCVAGTFSNTPGLANCADCATGQYGKTNGSTICQDCGGGTYQRLPGSTGCDPCEVGTFSTADRASVCSACSAGSFANTTGTQICLSCAKGKSQPTSHQTSCADCIYGTATNAGGQTTCALCTPGYYASLNGSLTCTQCAPGRAQSQNGQSSCSDCIQGWMANDYGLQECTQCDKGRYGNVTGMIDCIDCRAGYAQPSTGQSSCVICTLGQVSKSAASQACVDCGQGEYSAKNGSSSCISCPSGSFQDTPGSSSCSICIAGTATTATGQATCPRCVAGTYAPFSNATECIPCAAGTAQSTDGQTTCNNCTMGSFTRADSQSECALCPYGQYNTVNGSTECSQCAQSTYQSQPGQTFCMDCGVGTASEASGASICAQCQAGEYQALPAQDHCNKCPQRQAQLTPGSSNCTWCDLGTANSATGVARCPSCLAGHYADRNGSLECTQCEGGKFQIETGKSYCILCSPGRAVADTGNSDCTQCPRGKATNSSGLLECSDCDQGYAQNSPGQTGCDVCGIGKYGKVAGEFVCNDCDAGRYANGTASLACTPCGPGTFQIDTGATSCDLCPRGRYAKIGGLGLCTACEAGRYNNATGLTDCMPCAPGSSQVVPGSYSCDLCDAGHYQPDEGMPTCPGCAAGSFNTAKGLLNCTLCDAGTTQVDSGQTYCTPCDTGYYAPVPGSPTCLACYPGSYANETKTIGCRPCNKGEQQPLEGKSSCDACPKGTFGGSTGKSLCDDCPLGHHAATTGLIECDSCLAGEYQDQRGQYYCIGCRAGSFNTAPGQAQCTDCDIGRYNEGTNNQVCIDCESGKHQALPGQGFCDLCEPGSASSTTHADYCTPCAAGSVANSTGFQECTSCQRGTYQGDVGQSVCLRCGLGRHSAFPGEDACLECGAGTYANTTGLVDCILCPLGRYQDQVGQSACTLCAKTKFAANPGQMACTQCSTGTFGNVTGQSKCNNCPAGTYNPQLNQPTCKVCAVGHFSAEQQTLCTQCASGSVQPSTGKSVCLTCNVATSVANAARDECLCLAGYFLPNYIEGEEYACITCPTGADCSETGNRWDNIKALSGWWRSSNASLNFYECLLSWQCTGGAANSNTGSLSGFTTATGCADNRDGNLCAHCKLGYREETGGTCVACPQSGVSVIYLILVAIAIILLIWLQIYVVLKSGHDNVLRARWNAKHGGAGNAFDDDEEAMKNGKLDDEADDDAVEDSAAEGDGKKSGSDDGDDDGEGDDAEGGEKETADKPVKGKKGKKTAAVIPAAAAADGDNADPVNGDSDPKTVDAKLLPRHMYVEKLRTGEKQIIYEPAPPGDNFMSKLKIFLGFVQIVTNLGTGLEMKWPTTFKNFLQYFDVVNFDFILSNVTSSDCFSSWNYYWKFLFIVCLPVAIFLVMVIFWILPLEFEWCCFRHSPPSAKKRSKERFWKLFLYSLFLIYPGVSSTVLRLYVCKQIDTEWWLLTDLRVQCYTTQWTNFSFIGMPLILLYPAGIPIFFFAILRMKQALLHTDPHVHNQLGFLYEGYREQIWWFELVDLFHKLFLTSILAFIPSTSGWQLPVGQVWAVMYLMLLLWLSPYKRRGDDRLHQFAQTEIFLLLLAGSVFKALDDTYDYTNDLLMTTCLIALTIFFLLYFVYHAIIALHFMWGKWWDKCTAQRRAKQETDEARRKKMEPSGIADYDPEAAQAQPHKGKVMSPRAGGGDGADDESRPATAAASNGGSRPQTGNEEAKGSPPDGSGGSDNDNQPDQEPMPEPAHDE